MESSIIITSGIHSLCLICNLLILIFVLIIRILVYHISYLGELTPDKQTFIFLIKRRKIEKFTNPTLPLKPPTCIHAKSYLLLRIHYFAHTDPKNRWTITNSLTLGRVPQPLSFYVQARQPVIELSCGFFTPWFLPSISSSTILIKTWRMAYGLHESLVFFYMRGQCTFQCACKQGGA